MTRSGLYDAPPETDVARLQAEVSRLKEDRQRAECMASIQRDAVQLALDLLVTHPDLRGFFRMFTKRLRDDSGAYHSWVYDDVQGIRVEVHDPLEQHLKLLRQYSDADMHNILAYLETLK